MKCVSVVVYGRIHYLWSNFFSLVSKEDYMSVFPEIIKIFKNKQLNNFKMRISHLLL